MNNVTTIFLNIQCCQVPSLVLTKTGKTRNDGDIFIYVHMKDEDSKAFIYDSVCESLTLG